MKKILLSLTLLFQFFVLFAQPLKVASDNHHLITNDGKVFFWLGDTGWELFHRLNREEAVKYLDNRAEKGFNIIQAVVLYELQRETPNDYGDFPLQNMDISKPLVTKGNNPDDTLAYDYWDHVEFIISEAAKRNIIMGLLPCWGEYVTPRFHEAVIKTPQAGYDYGYFIGNRFKHLNNSIVWILGGDRLPDESQHGVETWRAMAEGITDAVSGEKKFDKKADYTKTFMTFHCYRTSAVWFHNDQWIDMHTYGSYHEKRNNERAYLQAYNDYNLPNHKPTLNSEPAYELLPVNYDWENAALGRFDAFDVRQIAYWSVFSGTCGHTYGCHPVWQMYKKKNPNPPLTKTTIKEWLPALNESGAYQMGYLKNLILSRPFLTSKPDSEILTEHPHDHSGRLKAISGDGFALVYAPTGKSFRINLTKISKQKIKAWWFNPRNGKTEKSEIIARPTDAYPFDPPGKEERANDWVLVLDDVSKQYSEPGK